MKYILPAMFMALGVSAFISCDDMLDMGNEDVLYTGDNTLKSADDTVNTYVGILYQLQKIAIRTNLFGELRGDLTSVYSSADASLKDIADFNVTSSNAYNLPRDYYAVINSCNFFIANADVNLKETRYVYGMAQDYYVLRAEYVSARAIRAWLYLQLGQIYGVNIPVVTDPVQTLEEVQAQWENAPHKDLRGICDIFIDDLEQYKSWFDYPSHNQPNRTSILPIQLVLGDLYLWRSSLNLDRLDAEKAAKCYYDYIAWTPNAASWASGFNNNSYKKVNTVDWNRCCWTMENGKYVEASAGGNWKKPNYVGLNTDISAMYTCGDLANGNRSNEVIATIAMDDSKGATEEHTNMLHKLYSSSEDEGNVPASLGPSQPCIDYSNDQIYGDYYRNSYSTTPAFIKRDDSGISESLKQQYFKGDLRLGVNVRKTTVDANDMQYIHKISDAKDVILYRTGDVYLRMAEALNAAGYPKFAKYILTTGLDLTVIQHLYMCECKTQAERDFVSYFRFPRAYFKTQIDPSKYDVILYDTLINTYYPIGEFNNNDRVYVNQIGLHQRGSGNPIELEDNGYYYPHEVDIIPHNLTASAYDASANCPQTFNDLMFVPTDIRIPFTITSSADLDVVKTSYSNLIDRAKAIYEDYSEPDLTEYDTEAEKVQAVKDFYNRLMLFHYEENIDWKRRNVHIVRDRQQEVIDSLLDIESALETCFEGYRFGFLMRADYRCGGTGRKMGGGKTYAPGQYLAEHVGKRNSSIQGKLMDRNNWFIGWKDDKTGTSIGVMH